MTDHPNPSSTQTDAPDASQAFASMGAASLGLFQDWLKAAGSAMPGVPGAATGAASQAMGSMGAWTMPTLDPQELEKRIQDLRTVQFWLEQNARMIAMTIQGLEVQKMTLDTLKGMNVSMEQLRETLKAQVAPSAAAPEPASAADEPPAAAPAGDPNLAGADLINPMRWWDTLTQQFTQMAAQAAQATASAAASAGAGNAAGAGTAAPETAGGTQRQAAAGDAASGGGTASAPDGPAGARAPTAASGKPRARKPAPPT